MRRLAMGNLAFASISAVVLVALAVFLGLAYAMILVSLASAVSVFVLLKQMRLEAQVTRRKGADAQRAAEDTARYSLVVHTALVLSSALLCIMWIGLAAALLAQGNPRLFDLLDP